MAKYRVLEKSYIFDKIYEPGTVVELPDDFPAGKALEPVGDEKRPPKPSFITGQPGPDGGSPPPQREGKSEYDEGGPTRATAQRLYDEDRLADQEVSVPSYSPQDVAAATRAEGSPPPAEPPPPPEETPPPGSPATDEGPRRKRKEPTPEA
jgi:hypothetical protein